MNVMERLQLAPEASVVPQPLVREKPEAFVPVSPMLVILRGAVPGLLKVNAWAALVVPTMRLPKANDAGERTAWGATTAVPEPLNGMTAAGIPGLVDVMVRAALKLPAAFGVKVTE